jgi:hypothetical protein
LDAVDGDAMRYSDRIRPDVGERWLILAVLFLARTAMAFQFQAVAALSSFVVADFGIDYAQLGLLIGLYLLPGIVIAYPGGLLGQYFGDKRIALIGVTLMVAGGLLTATENFPTVLAGRLTSGVGAVLLNVLLTKMTTDWFVRREIGTALALLVSSWPIGIGLALIILPWLAARASFATTLASTAAVAALALILIATIYRVPPVAVAPPPPSSEEERPGLSLREFGLVSLAGSSVRCCSMSAAIPDRQLRARPADVTSAILAAGRRLRDQPGLLEPGRYDPAGGRSDRSNWPPNDGDDGELCRVRTRHLACADGAFAHTYGIRWGCSGSTCGRHDGAAGRGAASVKSRRWNGSILYVVLRGYGVADTGRGHSPRRQRRARRALALRRRLGVCGDGRFGFATTVAAPIQDVALGLSTRWSRLWIRIQLLDAVEGCSRCLPCA